MLSTVPNYDYLNKTFSRSDSRHCTFLPTLGPPRQLECVVLGPLFNHQSKAEAGLRSYTTVAEGHLLVVGGVH